MASQSKANTRKASPAEGQGYLSKSREYLGSAEHALGQEHYVAAAGNAVLSGIAASDAISVFRVGQVWQGEHPQAASFLGNVGGDEGKQAAKHLRSLMPLKNRTAYEPGRVSAGEAEAAVKAAQRLLTIAERVAACSQ